MTHPDDTWNSYQARLQMYAYYGAISFQTLAIFFAASFLLITLPFTTLPHSQQEFEVWHYIFDLSSEGFAFVAILVGIGLFCRNQKLANRWVCVRLPDGRSLEDWINVIEQRIPRETLTGRFYANLAFYFLIAYNLLATLLLVLIWHSPL